jgi:muramoyltetrapeptide carboxypeptidase
MRVSHRSSGPGIAIVAPGGYAPDREALDAAIASLRARGCTVHSHVNHVDRHQRFGATDEMRVKQLHDAARDDAVQVVLGLRGGYGATRLLPHIDFNLLANSGKLFVGYSDFTALSLALLAKAGGVSFSGPMVCDDFTRSEPSEYTMSQFWECIGSPTHIVEGRGEGNPALEVSGTLWGGNLSMVAHLVGTPYLPRIDGGILFLEDIAEHPYRIERMMLQLLHAGILHQQKAVLLGNFSGYRLSDYDNGYSFEAMLAWLREECARFGVPILTGLPCGHVPDKAMLPVGGAARLESSGENFRLTIEAYPYIS